MQMCEIEHEAQFFAWVSKKLTPAQFELMRSIKENGAEGCLNRTAATWNQRAVQSLAEIGLLFQSEGSDEQPGAHLTGMGQRVCQYIEV